MLPSVMEFSSGYYVIDDMYVEPINNVSRVSMEPALYEYIRSDVYEGSRTPITIKYGDTHYTVRPEAGVPIDTLAVPPGVLKSLGESPPGDSTIYLARPKSSYRINQMRAHRGYINEA